MQQRSLPAYRTRSRVGLVAAIAAVLLAACGGGGDDGPTVPPPPLTCSVTDQKTWLSAYFDDSYFWYRLSPRPDPAAPTSVDQHFKGLLYTGTDPNFPADRWSGYESTESFNRFYGDGQTLGYGLSVAGLEVSGQPGRPLYVRGVDPGSPAAVVGLVRGDTILALNGRSSADIIAADDFSALSPSAAGQSLAVLWRTAAGLDRAATLMASVYALTPLPRTQVVVSPSGRKLGYLEVRHMISQVASPLEAAFAQFRAQGVNDVVLDLRYNGGGLVSMGGTIASYLAGNSASGQVYAKLLYSDRKAALNQSFLYANPAPLSAAGVRRVYLLMGRRTCSASEQIINGLRGVGIEVIGIGETSCGKPLGFLPQSDSCGTTYSIVNFESVNALNQGRYFGGFLPTCAVAEDWTQAVGGSFDPLLNAARVMADGGACPAAAAARQQPLSARRASRASEPWERQGMIAR